MILKHRESLKLEMKQARYRLNVSKSDLRDGLHLTIYRHAIHENSQRETDMLHYERLIHHRQIISFNILKSSGFIESYPRLLMISHSISFNSEILASFF